MKLEQVHFQRMQGNYPAKGNAYVLDQRVRCDEHGFDIFIALNGSSHSKLYSQAGCFDGAKWEFEVVKGTTSRQVGVNIGIKIDSQIWSDVVPPDIAYSRIIVDLDSVGFGHLFRVERSSNDGQGSVVAVNKKITLQPLLPQPRALELKLDILCHVVLDRAASSRATQETMVLVGLEPFTID